ncbi:hypothetical protein G7Y79_00018g045170 [Physcia stellaris]|nr:hypothetical protein G7Y79_00018g045170 [Physcia stellaris]
MTTSKESSAVGRSFIKQDHKEKSDLRPSDLRSSAAGKSRNAKIPNAKPTGQKEGHTARTGRTAAVSSKVVGKRKLADDTLTEEPVSKKAKTIVHNVYQCDKQSLTSDVDVASGVLSKKSKSQLQKLPPGSPSDIVPKVGVEEKANVHGVDKLKSSASKKLKDKEKLTTTHLPAINSIFTQARKIEASASLKNPAKVNTKRTIDQCGHYEENAPKKLKSKQTSSAIKNTAQKKRLPQNPKIRSGARRKGAQQAHTKPITNEKPEDVNQLASLLSTTSETQDKIFSAGSTSKPQAIYIQQSFDEDLGKSAKQIQKEIQDEAAKMRRREALIKAKNPFISKSDRALAEQASPAPGPSSSGSEIDDEVEITPAQNTQRYRKTFRGLTGRGHGQCANAVTQCLATLPKVAGIYINKPDDSLLSEEELNEDLFGDLPLNIEHETGALFRELTTPSKSAIDISLYHQKLEREGDFGEETRGEQEVDASPYVKDWIKRHNRQAKLNDDETTEDTPLESMLKRKMKVTIECSGCHERTTQYEDITTPLQLSIPADKTEVTLEDCMDEYFQKQTLHNQECIWCEGSVEATKSTCFADLPPNLIVSLNRTDASGAKIRTPVRVNTGHMDFGRWVDGDQDNVSQHYELSSMVEHRGKSVSDGMYIATCRMHGSGEEMTEETGDLHEDTWRAIKDERLSKRLTSEKISKEHRDGLLFFLQRVE